MSLRELINMIDNPEMGLDIIGMYREHRGGEYNGSLLYYRFQRDRGKNLWVYGKYLCDKQSGKLLSLIYTDRFDNDRILGAVLGVYFGLKDLEYFNELSKGISNGGLGLFGSELDEATCGIVWDTKD